MSELYELPDGWEWKTLDEFATIKSGKRVPKGQKLSDVATPYPYIRVTDFSNDGTVDTSDIKYISEEIHQQIKNYTITDSDIYISVAGTIGKTGIIPVELNGANLTENAVKIVFDNAKYDKGFIFNFTNSITFMEQIGLATKTVAMPKLAIKRLKEVNIPLPPLPEQQKIVTKLDLLFEKIDRSIALHQKNMDEADVFMGSVLNDVFGELEERYGKTSISKVMKISNKTLVPNDNEEYNYVGLENIESNNGKLVDFSTTLGSEIKSSKVVFEKGMVLYGKLRPYLNKVWISDFNGVATTEILPFYPIDKTGLEMNYVKYYFLSPSYLSKVMNNCSGARMPRLTTKFIKSDEAYIPFPPLSIQQKTVKYLDQISEKTEKVKSVQKEKMESLKALKASILDRAFRGEL